MEGIFVGYDEHRQGGYLVWIPKLKKVISSRDVTFGEDKFTIGRSEEWVDPFEEEQTVILKLFEFNPTTTIRRMIIQQIKLNWGQTRKRRQMKEKKS